MRTDGRVYRLYAVRCLRKISRYSQITGWTDRCVNRSCACNGEQSGNTKYVSDNYRRTFYNNYQCKFWRWCHYQADWKDPCGKGRTGTGLRKLWRALRQDRRLWYAAALEWQWRHSFFEIADFIRTARHGGICLSCTDAWISRWWSEWLFLWRAV